MKHKPDWPEARQRLTDWWQGRDIDRVPALVTAPRRGVTPRAYCGRLPDLYTDPATVFANLDAQLESTFFGGEAIPAHWIYLGPVPLSGIMGCGMDVRSDTVWHVPCFDSWSSAEELAFDPSNPWYRLLRDLTRASLQRAHGDYLVSGQGFGCVADVIADLWGCESALAAMAERPVTIRAVVRKLVAVSKALYDEFDVLTASSQEGAFDWLNLWAPGRIWTMQCDLCCMISPAMFQDFVVEELRAEAEHVDFAFYHLDGPGAIRHLDALLAIEALDGIQWVPGASASQDPMDWIPLFRRIQAAGKKLLIYSPPERVRPLLASISRRDVCLGIHCADQDAAEQVLRDLAQIGV